MAKNIVKKWPYSNEILYIGYFNHADYESVLKNAQNIMADPIFLIN